MTKPLDLPSCGGSYQRSAKTGVLEIKTKPTRPAAVKSRARKGATRKMPAAHVAANPEPKET